MTFADKLRLERARLGISQAELAKVLGDVSLEAVSKWERGISTPSQITQEGALARLKKLKPKKQSA